MDILCCTAPQVPGGLFLFVCLWGIEQFEGILPKGPYQPYVSMAVRAFLAGYPRIELPILSMCTASIGCILFCGAIYYLLRTSQTPESSDRHFACTSLKCILINEISFITFPIPQYFPLGPNCKSALVQVKAWRGDLLINRYQIHSVVHISRFLNDSNVAWY